MSRDGHSDALSLSNTVVKRGASLSTRAEVGEFAGHYHLPAVRSTH